MANTVRMETLREYLDIKSISQTSFAASLGISRSYMSEILAGTKVPALDLAVRIECLTDGKIRPADFISRTATTVNFRSQEEKSGAVA